MTDTVSKEIRSRIMASVKSKNTKPEKKVRKALHALGYRYRLHVKDLPGKPDIVFPKYNAIIEVNGCFWHLHECNSYNLPSSNESYWIPKLRKNKKRDKKNIAKLKESGWRIMLIWECAFNKLEHDFLIKEIENFLNSNKILAELP